VWKEDKRTAEAVNEGGGAGRIKKGNKREGEDARGSTGREREREKRRLKR